VSEKQENQRIAEALAESPEKVLNIATHENVTLRFPASGLGTRYCALLIDRMIQVAALIIALVITFNFLRFADISVLDVLNLMFDIPELLVAVYMGLTLLSMLYFLLFELFGHGGTPGKWLLGLRVISATGEAASAGQILGRNFMRFFHSIPGGELLDGLFVLFTKNDQRAGDLAAGTVVVKFRRNKEFSRLLKTLSGGDREKADKLAETLLTPEPLADSAANAGAAPGRPAGAYLDQEEFNMLASYLNARKEMGARDAYDRRMVAFLAARSGAGLPKKMKPEQRLSFMNAVYLQNLACYQAAAYKVGVNGGAVR